MALLDSAHATRGWYRDGLRGWLDQVQQIGELLHVNGAHWDAESCGMVGYEKASKAVLGLGPPDPAFIARGEQNFARFAAVLDASLRGKTWLLGERLTIAAVLGLVYLVTFTIVGHYAK